MLRRGSRRASSCVPTAIPSPDEQQSKATTHHHRDIHHGAVDATIPRRLLRIVAEWLDPIKAEGREVISTQLPLVYHFDVHVDSVKRVVIVGNKISPGQPERARQR